MTWRLPRGCQLDLYYKVNKPLSKEFCPCVYPDVSMFPYSVVHISPIPTCFMFSCAHTIMSWCPHVLKCLCLHVFCPTSCGSFISWHFPLKCFWQHWLLSTSTIHFEQTDRLFLCYSSFSVLTAEERQQLFPPVLPAFVRFCKAFPPLMEDVVGLLLQYGRICASEDSLQPLTINGGGLSPDLVNGLNSSMAASADPKERHRLESLPQQVQDTFAAILDNSVLEKRLYWNTT